MLGAFTVLELYSKNVPFLSLTLLITIVNAPIQVRTNVELNSAVRQAKPGDILELVGTHFVGGIFIENLHGSEQNPILIRGPKTGPRVRIMGGGGVHLSKVSFVQLERFDIEGSRTNGLNVDDGGFHSKPSHHISIRDIGISSLPTGNHDAIKLSGVNDFRVENCQLERWGGSAIDMVGCHRGVIRGNTFRNGESNSVQCKGGTTHIKVQRNKFEAFGQRGVNIGGSTGREFFRPPLSSIPHGSRFEAKAITVEGNIFLNGGAPVAFVGVDGAVVRFNTIVNPGNWVLRILQESSDADFVKCRNGVFSNNLIIFRSSQWRSGGVNVGPGTSPETFQFERNFWFCQDQADMSKPHLPVPERAGTYGVDPMLDADFQVRSGSAAKHVGAHAWREDSAP